jgi:uncharacterized delta-60 repeat protein
MNRESSNRRVWLAHNRRPKRELYRLRTKNQERGSSRFQRTTAAGPLLLCVLACWAGGATFAFSQNANDGFDPDVGGDGYAHVNAVAVQPDGRILIGGDFNSVGGTPRTNLARLNVDGSLDASFNPGADHAVLCLAVDPDGRILVGGVFNVLGGQPRANVGRLLPDGRLDASFNPGADDEVWSFAVQPDGRILVGGAFTVLGGEPRHFLGRLSTDGSLDASFDPGADGEVDSLGLQPDGKILVGGWFVTLAGQRRVGVGRLDADGSLDTAFAPQGSDAVLSLVIQPDGRILLGGRFDTMVGRPRNGIARLNPDGTLDDSFFPSPDDWVNHLALQPDGKILIGGEFTSIGGTPRQYIARLNLDGTLDTEFSSGANGSVKALAVQADGKIVVAGAFTTLGGTNRSHVGRLHNDSSLDSNFDPRAGPVGPLEWNGVNSFVIQPNGKIVVGGSFTTLGGQPRNHIGRLNADGSLDSTFDPGADMDGPMCLAIQADGKILVGGYFWKLGGQPHRHLGRLHTDGSADATFNPQTDGYLRCLAVQPDGKIVIGGEFRTVNGQPRRWIARLAADGSLDDSFDPGANGNIRSLAVQGDGKILVGGEFNTLAGQTRSCVGRLNADGSLDTAFCDPLANIWVYCLAAQADGRIVIGGAFTSLGGSRRNYLGRINSDGSLDASFNPGAGSHVLGLAIQVDGKILVGGFFNTLAGYTRNRIGRLNADGSLDASFDPGAGGMAYPSVQSLAVQADGKILAGGAFGTLGGQMRDSIGRLTSGNAALQRLEVDPTGTTITWNRAGTGPEVEHVVFQQSSDGVSYATLGNAARISNGWQLDGLSLPRGRNAYVRARGFAGGGSVSSGLIESVRQFYLPDTVPPEITCPPEVNATADAGQCYATGLALGLPAASDDSGAVTVTNNAPAQFSVGVTLVTWTASDPSGNTNRCTQNVTVMDDQPPTTVCPAPVTVNADPGLCSKSNVTWTVTSTDNCVLGPVVQCAPPGGATFPLGTSTVTCIAMDASGNSSQCTFPVIILDAEPPTLWCPPDFLGIVDLGQCSKSNVTWTVVAGDNCTVNPTVSCVPASGTAFPVGTNRVTCSAVDASGNTNSCRFTVTILDTQPPSLVCPSNLVAVADPGQCSRSNVTWTVAATDNCAPEPARDCVPPSGATLPVGTSVVVCRAADGSGNTNTCVFSVTIVDAAPPGITCPGDITVEFTSRNGAPVSFTVAATDNCAAAVELSCVPTSGSTFPIGTTTVVCSARDLVGNSTSCRFQVTVLGARGVKEHVLAELTALRATVTRNEDADKLDDALTNLTKSLAPELWMDQTHLERKHGDRAIQEEKETVRKLCELAKDKKGTVPTDLLVGFIDRITAADRLLAVVLIADATAAGAARKKIEHANRELARGDSDVSNPKCGDGIEDYKNAWKLATRAKLEGSVHLRGGRLELEILGTPGDTYLIQASTNLVDWVPLDTRKADAEGVIQFEDSTPGRLPARFYRVVELVP